MKEANCLFVCSFILTQHGSHVYKNNAWTYIKESNIRNLCTMQGILWKMQGKFGLHARKTCGKPVENVGKISNNLTPT